MLRIYPLYSGSSGNSTLVRSDNCNILIDVGLGYKTTLSALKAHNLSPEDISAIVVTHEHVDHIGGICQFVRRCPVKVYAPSKIVGVVCERAMYSEVYGVDGRFDVGDLTADVYKCSHDSAACVGYRFTDGHDSVASVTDTGCTNSLLVDFLAPCHTVQLESNHDVDMLKNGPYPYQLKRRILSDVGHLSNAQAAEVLQQLVGSNVKKVILAHLSEHNNTAELAFRTAVDAYADKGLYEGRDIDVYVAAKRDNKVTE